MGRLLACGVWLSSVLGAAGCASSDPRPPEHLFLRVGVDPEREALEVERTLADAGFRVTARLAGPAYRALSFRRADGHTAVRVVTGRGVALAIDAPARGASAHAEVWLATDVPTARDLDGDGAHELVVAVRPGRGAPPCLGLARIGEGGLVHEVPMEPGSVRSGSCVEAVRDVGGDGRPEALVVERHPGLVAGEPPAVPIPLAGRSGRWRRAPVRAYDAFFDRERDRRMRSLERAREERRVRDALRLGVELAALAKHRDEDASAQVRAFDRAMRGLVLSEAQARRTDCIRAHIRGGWAPETATC